MAQLISTYLYTYGAGNTPNRKVEFYADGSKVWGEVSAKRQNAWHETGKINENQMTKEAVSTSKKMKIMLEARKTFKSPEYPADKSFSELPYAERIKVIENLDPTGSFRITFRNDIGEDPFFEKVKSLTFFDPT